MVKSKLLRILIGLACLATILVGQPAPSMHVAALAGARAAVRPSVGLARPAIAGDALWDSRFMLGADDWIFAAVFAPNGDLYVGGDFNQAGGAPANAIAGWNLNTQSWSNLAGGMVHAITGPTFARWPSMAAAPFTLVAPSIRPAALGRRTSRVGTAPPGPR